MNGLRLVRDPTGKVPQLEAIAVSIAPVLTDCYWIVSECLWRAEAHGIVADDAWFDDLVLARDGDRRLFRQGTLSEIAPFIDNDWCHLFGVPEPIDPSKIVASRDFLERHARVYLTCVDGVRWEVFSSDLGILDALRTTWPDAETIELPADAFLG